MKTVKEQALKIVHNAMDREGWCGNVCPTCLMLLTEEILKALKEEKE